MTECAYLNHVTMIWDIKVHMQQESYYNRDSGGQKYRKMSFGMLGHAVRGHLEASQNTLVVSGGSVLS